MGVSAMILSGTRTSWLAGIVVLVTTVLFYLDRYSLGKRLLLTLALICGIALVGSTLSTTQHRINQMVEMVAPYVKGEEPNNSSSLGLRVQAWAIAWNVGRQNPVFGFGPGNMKSVIKTYAREKPQLSRVADLKHIHNQFLQTFAMSGLVGLLSLLVLFICHFWLFGKYLNGRYSPEVRYLALSGLLLLIAYLIKSVPGVPFYGKNYLMMYGFASASIWGCLLGALRESELDSTRDRAEGIEVQVPSPSSRNSG